MGWLTDKSNSAHVLTASGDAAVSTATWEFGGGSLQLSTLNGSGMVSAPSSSDWTLGTNPFTIEFWCDPTTLPVHSGTSKDDICLVGTYDNPYAGGMSGTGWGVFYYGNATPVLVFAYNNGSNQQAWSTPWSPTPGQFVHIAITRDASSKLYFFINGVLQGTPANIGTMTSIAASTLPLTIGNSNALTDEWDGFIDELRITNGVCRYTASFTPVGPFPVGSGSDASWANVVLLASFDGSNTYSITGDAATGAVGTVGVSTSETLPLGGVGATGVAAQLGPENMANGNEGLQVSGAAGVGAAGSVTPFLFYPMYLTQPTPTLSAVGWESDKTQNLTGTVAATEPTPQLQVSSPGGWSISTALTMPTPTLTATGLVTNVGVTALTMPTPGLTVGALAGISASVAVAMPLPVLAVTEPTTAALVMPMPLLSAGAIEGAVGTAYLGLPVPQVDINAQVPFVASPALNLPMPQLAANGVTGIVGASVNTLRGFALAAEGATGVVGTATLTLPVYALDVDGYLPMIGVVELTMPSLQLMTVGGPAATGAPATVVMHTETNAVSEYTNYPFNSFAQFNGVYLGAGANGLFALTGDTDAGTIINAAARVGITDFGTSHLKRVDRAYVGYRTDGNLIMSVFTDETVQRDYLLSGNGYAGLHGAFTRFGKGLAARYYQFQIANQNGAYFDMNMIELKPTELKRRIGGFDA
jgi:hypothetical protein